MAKALTGKPTKMVRFRYNAPMPLLTVGDPMPEFTPLTSSGEPRKLSESWNAQLALLLWLRHFG